VAVALRAALISGKGREERDITKRTS